MRHGLMDRAVNEDLTNLLGQDELVVTTGFYGQYPRVHLSIIDPGNCPFCGAAEGIQNKELRTKLYKDITEDESRIFIFCFDFYKYSCTMPSCKKTFRQSISFAGVDDDVTHRLERKIADLVIAGHSYADISKKYPEIGTKTTVGNIYRRWVDSNIGRVSGPYTPAILGIFEIPYDDERDSFVIFTDCGNPNQVVLGVVPSDRTRLQGFLDRLDLQKVMKLVVNASDLVIGVATDLVPSEKILIPVHEWLHLVEEDFRYYFASKTKHCMLQKPVDTLMAQEYRLTHKGYDLDSILKNRPELGPARDRLFDIRRIVSSTELRWSMEELDDWVSGLSQDLAVALGVSIAALGQLRDMLSRSADYRFSSSVYWDIDGLRRKFHKKHYCSESYLIGFFLMKKEEYMKKVNDIWYGVPLEVVLENETVVDYEE